MTAFNQAQPICLEERVFNLSFWSQPEEGAPGGLEIIPGTFNGAFYCLFTTSTEKRKSSTHCHNAAHIPPTSRPPLLRDHRHHWVPAKFSNSTFFSTQGIAAIAAEQDPVLQLFAELETSFSSSQFKLRRDWNSLTLHRYFPVYTVVKNIFYQLP